MELDLVERYLPTLQLAELNQLAAKWISEANRVVLVTAPDSEAAALPSKSRSLLADPGRGRSARARALGGPGS